VNPQNTFTTSLREIKLERCATFRNNVFALHMQLSNVCCSQRSRMAMPVEAAPTKVDNPHPLNGMFHMKSLWVVRFFWNNHLLRVRRGLRLRPRGISSHSLLLLQILHGKASWFLVNASFFFLDWECGVSGLQTLIGHHIQFAILTKGGARGPETTTPESILDSTWKVSEAIFSSRRRILKRRSGIFIFDLLQLWIRS
jgi:hypothetical protein